MIYPVSEWMLIGTVFLSFLWGLLFGIRYAKRKFVMQAMQRLTIDEAKKLLGDVGEVT